MGVIIATYGAFFRKHGYDRTILYALNVSNCKERFIPSPSEQRMHWNIRRDTQTFETEKQRCDDRRFNLASISFYAAWIASQLSIGEVNPNRRESNPNSSLDFHYKKRKENARKLRRAGAGIKALTIFVRDLYRPRHRDRRARRCGPCAKWCPLVRPIVLARV